MVSERELVTVQVANSVVAQPIESVLGRHDDLDAAGSLELVKLVGIANYEVDRAPFGIGLPSLQEHLHVAEVHARDVWGIAEHEGDLESKFRPVELGRRSDVADLQ